MGFTRRRRSEITRPLACDPRTPGHQASLPASTIRGSKCLSLLINDGSNLGFGEYDSKRAHLPPSTIHLCYQQRRPCEGTRLLVVRLLYSQRRRCEQHDTTADATFGSKTFQSPSPDRQNVSSRLNGAVSVAATCTNMLLVCVVNRAALPRPPLVLL